MRIEDSTKKVIKEKENLEKITRLAMIHFGSKGCSVSKAGELGVNISDSSGRTVAYFSDLISPHLKLYDFFYEEVSKQFGEAYEREILGMTRFPNNILKAREFVLEKDYSEKEK